MPGEGRLTLGLAVAVFRTDGANEDVEIVFDPAHSAVGVLLEAGNNLPELAGLFYIRRQGALDAGYAGRR